MPEDTDQTDPVTNRAELIPFEIRDAIEALSGDRQQAIVVTLLDEGQMAFNELKEELDLHSQQLTNAIDDLLNGGMIRKRSSGDPTERYQAYYEVTEYGERFVDCTLSSLGSVNSGNRPEARRQQINHIHNQKTESPVEVMGYTQTIEEEERETNPAS